MHHYVAPLTFDFEAQVVHYSEGTTARIGRANCGGWERVHNDITYLSYSNIFSNIFFFKGLIPIQKSNSNARQWHKEEVKWDAAQSKQNSEESQIKKKSKSI